MTVAGQGKKRNGVACGAGQSVLRGGKKDGSGSACDGFFCPVEEVGVVQ